MLDVEPDRPPPLKGVGVRGLNAVRAADFRQRVDTAMSYTLSALAQGERYQIDLFIGCGGAHTANALRKAVQRLRLAGRVVVTATGRLALANAAGAVGATG